MKVEQIADLPLLGAAVESLKLVELIDAHFAVHGNRGGASLGTVCAAFLLYVMSEGDHRLSHVQEWCAAHEVTLRQVLNCPTFTHLDCTDDRLASFLDYFSSDEAYREFETAWNKSIISVYSLNPSGEDLSAEAVHLDATIAQSFKDISDLFTMGYAKHRRPDLAQVKVMLSTYGSFGLPLCVEVVKGSTADDVLYLPMIARVRETLDKQGLLFVGDSKLGSIGNRLAIQKDKNYYLTPLSRVQLSFSELKTLIMDYKKQTIAATEITTTEITTTEITTTEIAATEIAATEITTTEIAATEIAATEIAVDGQKIVAFETTFCRTHTEETWQERIIVAFSPTYSATQIAAFDRKMAKTEAILTELTTVKQGKTPLKTRQDLDAKIDAVLQDSQTASFLEVTVTEIITKIHKRKYGNKPAQTSQTTSFDLTITQKKAETADHKAILGWRAYATNAPVDKLSIQKAIETYKAEFNIEYRFNQLHNKMAPLMPIFLHKDHRITALIRFLCLGIKVLGILEYTIRKNIAEQKITVDHIFPGNPGRKTDKPTIEMILRAFRNIALVIIQLDDDKIFVEISTLAKHQILFLQLAGFKHDIYTQFEQFLKSNPNINET